MQYEIKGGSFPAAICSCASGETLICESGAMSWMSPNMKMETSSHGGIGKVFGRMVSGETLFLNSYTAENGNGLIAFASSFPGDIRAIQITEGHDIIVQKHAFMACEADVKLSVFFQKKIGSGLFGGEGFIMERLSGTGTAFIEIDGSSVEYALQPGQSIVADTGYVAMMDSTCSMDIQTVPGIKNMLFGGEGLFNTIITGPGRVILQTIPLYGVARALAPYMPSSKS